MLSNKQTKPNLRKVLKKKEVHPHLYIPATAFENAHLKLFLFKLKYYLFVPVGNIQHIIATRHAIHYIDMKLYKLYFIIF